LFYGNPAGKKYGFGGGFLWVGLWEMKILNILVLAIKKSCKILWVPIMQGTQIL
jgi:hypothetical protein